MPPAHFQTHISFSHPPRGDDFHSLLPACRKKYILLSLHTSSATSRSGMKKNLNSHSPSTLFMAVSMFITLLLNHPFSRVEPSSVHPLCTWKGFFLSDHHLHSPSLYLFQFYYTLRDREHIPDTAIHGCLQQDDGIFFFSCISAQQVLIPYLFCECSEPVISLGLSSEGRGRDVCRLCIKQGSALPLLIHSPGVLRLMAQSLGTEQVWVGHSRIEIHHTLLFHLHPAGLRHYSWNTLKHTDIPQWSVIPNLQWTRSMDSQKRHDCRHWKSVWFRLQTPEL